ncbi:MAG TPA: cytochrome P450 [Polyangia bacterium]
MRARVGLPPGPREPAAIQLLEWTYRPLPFLERCARRYGEAFTVRLPGFGAYVYLSSPELIKQVFTGDASLLEAGKGNRILEPLLGMHSVLLLDGAEHLRQRRLLLPPFHGERMQAYAKLMREITCASLDTWPIGTPFSLHPQMQAITLDVILRAVFGLDEGAEMRELAKLLVALFAPPPFLFSFLPLMTTDLPLSPYRKFLRLKGEVDRALYAIIAERRRADAADRTDILSLLLAARDEEGRPMSDAELRDELVTMIAAGHETTATALSWAFERILATPEVAARLDAELASACGSDFDPTRAGALPYLDAVIKETLRLRPIIPLVVRQLKEPYQIAGHLLPAGAHVAPCIWLTQRRADLYPDPERFFPERFLDRKIDPYTWLPFGGGIRRCIGMAFAQFEMTIVLATVLGRLRLRLAPGVPVRTVRRSITFAPSGGTRVIAERR